MELDKTEKNTLVALRSAMDTVRAVDPEMPAQTLYTLLEVANQPGIAMSELQDKLGMSSAGMSRVIARLTELQKPGVPGLNFVTREENLMDRRVKIVHPTAKGLAFVRKLLKAL